MKSKSIKERLDAEKEKNDHEDSIDELLECVYGLNNLDIKCYKKIRDEERTWTDELSDELDKDESTVHRSVSRLSESGLIIEEKIPYENGGYRHEYTIRSTEKVAQEMRSRISKMLSSTIRQIDKIEGGFQRYKE